MNSLYILSISVSIMIPALQHLLIFYISSPIKYLISCSFLLSLWIWFYYSILKYWIIYESGKDDSEKDESGEDESGEDESGEDERDGDEKDKSGEDESGKDKSEDDKSEEDESENDENNESGEDESGGDESEEDEIKSNNKIRGIKNIVRKTIGLYQEKGMETIKEHSQINYSEEALQSAYEMVKIVSDNSKYNSNSSLNSGSNSGSDFATSISLEKLIIATLFYNIGELTDEKIKTSEYLKKLQFPNSMIEVISDIPRACEYLKSFDPTFDMVGKDQLGGSKLIGSHDFVDLFQSFIQDKYFEEKILLAKAISIPKRRNLIYGKVDIYDKISQIKGYSSHRNSEKILILNEQSSAYSSLKMSESIIPTFPSYIKLIENLIRIEKDNWKR